MSSSDQSDRSLRSKGSVPDTASLGTSKKVSNRKVAAIWEPEEEEALVTYLHTQAASAGDGVNFTAKTFTSASQKLLVDFPAYRGGEKTASSCRSKWIRVSFLSLIYAKPWTSLI